MYNVTEINNNEKIFTVFIFELNKLLYCQNVISGSKPLIIKYSYYSLKFLFRLLTAIESGVDLELKWGGDHFFKSKKKDNTRLQNNKSNLLIQIRMLWIYEIVNF
jgi:hypothetical protein